MEWLKLKYDKYKIKYNESDVECNHVRELCVRQSLRCIGMTREVRTVV